MPRVNMYKYTDLMDLRIRRHIANEMLNEHEFLLKHCFHSGILAKCRKSQRISRVFIVRLKDLGVNFKGIKFELDE